MNIRKPTDYTTLFTALDAAVAAQLPQMELYCEIGRVVSGRARERRRCRGVGIPASGLSRSRRLLSPQCAPDAGLLPDVRRYAGVAGSGNASELDTECGHHGGRN